MKIRWPFKKQQINLKLNKSLELKLVTSWSRYKNEVLILIGKEDILLDNEHELIIEFEGENINPIRLQVIPDFEKRVLNFIEIIDPNAKYLKSWPRFSITKNTIKQRNITFGEYLRNYDKNIQLFKKLVCKSKWMRNILVPLMSIFIFWNLYSFATKTDSLRYIDLGLSIFLIYTTYYIYQNYAKLLDEYKKYVELKDKLFGVVKEK